MTEPTHAIRCRTMPQSIFILQQPAGGDPLLPPAVLPISRFKSGSNRLVSDGQVARRSLLLLAGQLVNEAVLPRLRSATLPKGGREVSSRHSQTAEDLIKRQRHRRVSASAPSLIPSPPPRARRFRRWSRPLPRRHWEGGCPATSSSGPSGRPLPASPRVSPWSCFSRGQCKSPTPRSQFIGSFIASLHLGLPTLNQLL